MDDCQCGRSLCAYCLQVHTQETGHKRKVDLTQNYKNDREDMRSIFSGSISESFFTLFESFPEVEDYACMTEHDFFRSNIILKKEPFKNQRFIHDLYYPQYQKLLSSNGNDMAAFSEAYAQSVITDIRRTITTSPAKPEEHPKNHQVSAMYQIANISPIRYWGTIILLIGLSITLAGLILNRIFG